MTLASAENGRIGNANNLGVEGLLGIIGVSLSVPVALVSLRLPEARNGAGERAPPPGVALLMEGATGAILFEEGTSISNVPSFYGEDDAHAHRGGLRAGEMHLSDITTTTHAGDGRVSGLSARGREVFTLKR
jgi:hypothetical protein